MTAPTVVGLFRHQARRRPDHPAIVHPLGTLTYADLDHASDLLACALIDRGVTSASLIPVLFDRTPALYVALLSALKAGAAYFPLHPADPPQRLHHLLNRISARCLLTDARPAPWLPDPATPILRLDPLSALLSRPSFDDRLSASGGRRLCRDVVRPAPSDLAYVMPTSGSGGRPKGVMVEHRAVANLVRWAGRRFRIVPGDRVMQSHSATFDASVQEIFGALAHGATLWPVGDDVKHSPRRFLEWMREHRITHADLTPTYCRLLSRCGPVDLPDLKTLILGGEPLHGRDVLAWRNAVNGDHRLFNLYGPTEATVTATCHEIRSARPDEPVPIGLPITNVEAFVLDRNGHRCAAGDIGVLHLGGAGIARGYWHDPETPLHADGDLYRTGDLVHRGESGVLTFVGREDDQLDIHGHRVEPAEVEAALSSCLGLMDVAVAKTSDARLTCWFVPNPDNPVDVAAVRAHARATLPPALVPHRFHARENLPTTPTGKKDRRALAESGRSASD
ncbi:amino acid adenylation domain-containing protein [Actinocorallia sp. B10E7]|uniref:amino acid adenylation domain-containing protein n=1 Tax=Actinocorallia sp. B10E7 TaxID=3153558 RepID=UPI00325F7D0F